jgi:hypothetical protein
MCAEKSRPGEKAALPTVIAATKTKVTPGSDDSLESGPSAVYEASQLPRRRRRTMAALEVIDEAIVTAAATENPVTLRGVYYRVVSAGVVDKTEAGYQLVGRQLLKLRRSGRVPYSWITDGTRLVRKPASWSSLDEMLSTAARTYRRSLWDEQQASVIVLSEKDAISGVVYPVTARWDVELGIVRGYSSETFTYSIAESVLANDQSYKTTFIYQLGDHDPSGVDAWRSFQQRVRDFAPGADVEFERLAVTPEQIAQYELPTRPTKRSDTRASGFEGESVEVDALPPNVLREVVQDAILRHLDLDQLRAAQDGQRVDRQFLEALAGDAS